jgi:hypothetical protein
VPTSPWVIATCSTLPAGNALRQIAFIHRPTQDNDIRAFSQDSPVDLHAMENRDESIHRHHIGTPVAGLGLASIIKKALGQKMRPSPSKCQLIHAA